MKTILIIMAFLGVVIHPIHSFAGSPGILVLAHGVAGHSGGHGGGHGGHHPPHEGPWERTVRALVAEASSRAAFPVDLAFGMWERASFQAGVDRLAARGVTELRVVPLFISSHSMVIRAQHYLFGLLEENPLWFDPGKVSIPPTIKALTFSSALDDSRELSEDLQRRALELTEVPAREELVLVAHGPVSDEDDELWLRDLRIHASRIGTGQPIHVITLRDDAPSEVRDEMTRRLREIVTGITLRGHVALVLPVLLAPGGIEEGLLERLTGLSYRYRGRMLAPDPGLVNWIIRMATEF